MVMKEIDPTIRNINKNMYEEDLGIIVNELINLTFKDLNKEDEDNVRKQHIFNYIENHNIILLELYNWLLNNQINSNSIYFLGYFNYYGIETNINKQKVLELYQKAAKLGNVVAQLDLSAMLGYCYENGIGTDINEQKAIELFKKAADLGNQNGIDNLGCCYYFGTGTNINKQKAFELFQKAANLGNPLSQYNLVLMYENENAIKKEIALAIYWYKKIC
ncbi:hypothetical protein RclHR1_15440002 [Rhizophagus clarus]|uniref:Kinase-like domain-containing protein n=1 Tax=Rhizophagus clarus TaxID=94130 RepID=A0A2Z6QVV1_9GLOM|nr:hypothetical protein RclHR1_15440002 [Rhizophagus clarus]GES91058.1 kinase-like domain-containing protein [Rhizophagus clarus]